MKYTTIKPDSFAKLKRNHLIFGALYFLIGIFIFIGSLTIEAVKNFKPLLYINYITRVQSGTYGHYIYQITVDKINRIILALQNIPFMLIIGVILLISALLHILITTKTVNQKYNNQLQNGVEVFRGIEGIFNSILITLLAILIGISDINTIVVLLVLGLIYSFSALTMEQISANQHKTIWTPYIGMVLTFLASVFIAGFTTLKQLEIQQKLLDNATITVPYLKTLNYFILIVYFGFWLLQLIHLFLQHKKAGKWKNPILVENIHMTLNFLTKIAITGIVFYGLVNSLFTIYYI